MSDADRVTELEKRVHELTAYIENCIWVTPERMSGSPCIGGTRIPVSLAARLENEDDAEALYNLTPEQVKLARWFDERFLDRYPPP